jgi:hypothetical protein
VGWCIDHVGIIADWAINQVRASRREQQEQKDGRFLLLHVLARDDVMLSGCFYLQHTACIP